MSARFVPIVITLDYGSARAGVLRVRNDFKKLSDDAERTGSRVSTSFKKLFAADFLANLAGNAFTRIISFFREGASAVLNFSGRLEQAKIGFTTLLGSSRAADLHLKELQAFAIKTPFEFEDLIQASRRFQNMGLAAKEVIPLLTAVGDAVSAAGGGSAEIDRVSLALSQMVAKGRVSAEELNQLAESGIGGLRILEKHLGKTKGEILKLAEQGEISADVFINAFKEFSAQNFGGAMEKQSKTFLGSLSTIKDALLQTSETAFKPMFREISQISVRIAEQLSSAKTVGDIAEAAAQAFFDVGVAIGKAIWDGMEDELSRPDAWNEFWEGFAGKKSPYAMGARIQQRQDQRAREGDWSAFWEKHPALVAEAKAAQEAATQNKENAEAQKAVAAATAEQNKQAERAREIITDLTRQIQFFGSKTQVAATAQRLMAAGVKDLNSELARQALQLAENIDKLEAEAELMAAVKKLRDAEDDSLRSQLASVLDGAATRTQELRATFEGWGEVTKFLKSQAYTNAIEAGGEFANTAAAIVEQLKKLEAWMGKVEGMETRKRKMDELTESAHSLSTSLLNELNQPQTKFGEFLKDLEKVKNLPETFAFKVRDSSSVLKDFKPTPDLQVDEQTQRLAEFRRVFVSLLNEANTGKQGVLLTANEIENLAREFAYAADSALALDRRLSDLRAFEAFEEAANDLIGIIEADIKLTNRQRVEKLLLTNTYKGLTDAQKDSLLRLSDEADAQVKLREATAKTKERFEDSRRTLTSLFDDAIGTTIKRRWKGLMDFIVEEFKRALSRMLAAWLASKVLRFFNPSAGTSSSSNSGGGIWNSIKSFFNPGGNSGGGGMPWGSTPSFNSSGGISNIASGYKQGGMVGAIKSFFGIGASSAATVGGSGAATAGAMSGILGAGGAAGAAMAAGIGGSGAAAGSLGASMAGATGGTSAGLGASMMALATNPITLVAAGAIVGGLMLWKAFSNRTEKALRNAIRSEYAVDVRDMQTLKSVKEIGEQHFGKGKVRQNLLETIRLEPSKELIANYAEATGQRSNKLVLNREFGDPNFEGNQFIRRLAGGPVPGATRGRDHVRALLDGGEYVNTSRTVEREGLAAFGALNAGRARILTNDQLRQLAARVPFAPVRKKILAKLSEREGSDSAPVQIAPRAGGSRGAGASGGVAQGLVAASTATMAEVKELLEVLTTRLKSMSPEDMVALGAERNPQAIGRANNVALKNGSVRQEQQEKLGMRN